MVSGSGSFFARCFLFGLRLRFRFDKAPRAVLQLADILGLCTVFPASDDSVIIPSVFRFGLHRGIKSFIHLAAQIVSSSLSAAVRPADVQNGCSVSLRTLGTVVPIPLWTAITRPGLPADVQSGYNFRGPPADGRDGCSGLPAHVQNGCSDLPADRSGRLFLSPCGRSPAAGLAGRLPCLFSFFGSDFFFRSLFDLRLCLHRGFFFGRLRAVLFHRNSSLRALLIPAVFPDYAPR